MSPSSSHQQSTMIQTSTPAAQVASSGRLKYANPRDLPSYPSPGLRPDGAAASAAASLGWSNQKPIETWKPDRTSSASAAAALAKNYKMAPSWEPASDSAGAKAALLAVGSARAANRTTSPTVSQDGWGNSAATQAFKTTKTQPTKSTHDGWGNSAATRAFNTNRTNSMKLTSPNTTSSQSLQGRRSLAAAKGAMSSTRPRANSTPVPPARTDSYRLESLAASNALSGATLAHQASTRTKPSIEDTGAVSVTTMTRKMFTANPPVKPEVDEQENNDKLHASAVAMARKMYMQQLKVADQTEETPGEENSTNPKPQVNLQEAAFKQAQERLAKLQDEHQQGRDFKEYYGNSPSVRHRFSLTSKLRRRSSSDGDLNDAEQSERIRQQMSMFSNKLSQVDATKRQKDRDAVLAAAQRNVKAQLQGMDQKVYHETGQVNPSLMNEWELKANQAAYAQHEARTENKGKLDLGGGKFMDPNEVDAIASKRVQPVLDDINEKAEIERARLANLRLEEEAKKAEAERQKARDREFKDLDKKLKEHEKQEEKARKEEERASKAEQKRLAKEEKRKSKVEQDDNEREEEDEENAQPQGTNQRPTTAAIETGAATSDNEGRKNSDAGPSPTAKVKGWIKNRFSRGKSISEGDRKKNFIGGAALKDSDVNHSTASLDNRATSMREVALAGTGADSSRAQMRDSRGVSPVSSVEGDLSRDMAIVPPRPIEDQATYRSSSSPTRDSRFREMMD